MVRELQDPPLNICLIQTDPEAGSGNLDFALQAMRRNADVYILPELFTVGFRNGTASPSKYAEPLQGKTVQALQASLESKPDATIIAGLLEKDGGQFLILMQPGALVLFYLGVAPRTSTGTPYHCGIRP